MNLNLKFRIYEKFKTQWRFAQAVQMHESDVSRVIAGRKIIPEDTKTNWAKILGCKVGEIFDGSENS